ncbi:unnamed protein product [Ixodes persulcatus]
MPSQLLHPWICSKRRKQQKRKYNVYKMYPTMHSYAFIKRTKILVRRTRGLCAYSNAQGAAVKTKTFGTPCKIQISNIHIPKTGHANVILQNVLGIFLRVQLGAVQI